MDSVSAIIEIRQPQSPRNKRKKVNFLGL